MDHPRESPELFFLRNFNMDRAYGAMERVDFLPLYTIRTCAERSGPRVYLSSLSEEMGLSIPEVSRMVEQLQDKGYVVWKTDLSEGKTYVELTGKSVELMNDVHDIMGESYRRIQDEISPEELTQMTRTLKRVTAILDGVREMRRGAEAEG